MKPGHRDVQTDFEQRQTQLFKRDVLPPFPYTQDIRPPLLHPARAHVASLRLGSKAAAANPSRVVGPSMLASFTSTDSESENAAQGNPPPIQSVRNPL
jgi:hypothetical protein